MLLNIKLFIFSILLRESQNIALFRIRLLSSSTSFSLPPWINCEPKRKLRFALKSLTEDYYFFFLKALDIFKLYPEHKGYKVIERALILEFLLIDISFIITTDGGR